MTEHTGTPAAPRILFVDDRKAPQEFGVAPTTIARTFSQAVTALLDEAPFDELYLDYYLSDMAPKGPTGADVLRYVARMDATRIPPKVIGISGDPAMCDKVEAMATELREPRASETPNAP